MNAKPLVTRPLAKTGIELSELSLGTWGLCAESYGPVFEEQRTHTLKRALDLGIRAFDMAPCWGPDGLSERIVAQVAGGRRNELVYITRAGQHPHEYGWESDFSQASLRRSCEASLKRLATDRIDVFLLHNPGEHELRNDELHDTVRALVREGKARAWGASVGSVKEAHTALDAGAQVLCVPFNLFSPHTLWQIQAECQAHHAALLARSPLMYGLLSGRFAPKRRFSVDDHRSQRWSVDALAARVQQSNQLHKVYTEGTLTLPAVALRWVLAHDAVSSAIIGPRTGGQVEAAVQALEGTRPLMGAEQLETFRTKLGTLARTQ